MIRNRFSSEQIADIVMKLIGEIEPVGESNVDEKRLNNLILLENTIDILIDEIQFITPNKDRVEYSINKVGKESDRWLQEKLAHLRYLYVENE